MRGNLENFPQMELERSLVGGVWLGRFNGSRGGLRESLQRFAAFFREPLFTASATEREAGLALDTAWRGRVAGGSQPRSLAFRAWAFLRPGQVLGGLTGFRWDFLKAGVRSSLQ